jgi:hypothetical protein
MELARAQRLAMESGSSSVQEVAHAKIIVDVEAKEI